MNDITPLEQLLDSVRDMEGFPIGKDEDILALSRPPYYTACPNPYINDFIKEHGKPYDEATDSYHRTPFVGDVSEGKNDPIYNAHSYHTKVPHKAIMKYIEHYTEPGDIVFDGFCGTGMTGVAAQMLRRKAILSDLSPIATFIAHNYNTKIDVKEFENEAKRILDEVQNECGWMYETDHTKGGIKGKGVINFIVISDVLICPFCSNEIVFYKSAIDKETGKVLKDFSCYSCNASIKKNDCEYEKFFSYDTFIGDQICQLKSVPVLINYKYKKKRFEKIPEKKDFDLINSISDKSIPYWYPNERMPMGDESRRNDRHGITHVHHFYTKQNLWILAALWDRLDDSNYTHHAIRMAHSAANQYVSKMRRYRADKKGGGPLAGTLYLSSICTPPNAIKCIERNIGFIKNAFYDLLHVCNEHSVVSTQSATNLGNIQSNSVDYVFTDPPFGDNLMYSELNFIWESWIKIITNNISEAIVNKAQNKDLNKYHILMLQSFKECYRILKPNRWITVEFHNSRSSVWNSIQDALTKAGFVVANVAVLDKKQGSFKQVTSSGAVKNDLVISAYKPKENFHARFHERAGEGMEEQFIRMHLGQLPVEPSFERTEQMLYSKLLAYYVQRGYTIKYNAVTFFKMLEVEFTQEDAYWFLPEQLPTYNDFKQKMQLGELGRLMDGQGGLFVSDEKSAIIWLAGYLSKPQSFQSIYPAFYRIASIGNDKMPELKDILAENFVLDGDRYRLPQSEQEKLALTEKRHRGLLREFEALLREAQSSKKKIKEVRKQAVLFGFEDCYRKQRYQDILLLARRLHPSILENDSELNEFAEIAEVKVEGM